MKYFKKQSTIKPIFALLAIILVAFNICLQDMFAYPTFTICGDVEYTNVLVDLQKDKNFDFADYPAKKDDYSIKLIQIAESANKELFIYVYSPSSVLKATSVNFCITEEFTTPKNYKLELLSENGTLSKYLVKDFVVKDYEQRFYNFSSIFRKFNIAIDTPPSDTSQTISEVSFDAGQLWSVSTAKNGQVSYNCTFTDVVTIIDKYVGFLRYTNGFNLQNSSCDSHYVAFSTDKDIDALLEADIYFVQNSVVDDNVAGVSKGKQEELYKTLTYIEKVSKPAGGIGGYKHVWNRIESTSEFLKNENLKSDVKNEVAKKDWVLRFSETEYRIYGNYIHNFLHKIEWYTEVTDVSILRLKFETNGVVYNLGVVDNKQSGDLIPDNKTSKGLPKWLKILIIVLCVLLVIVALPVLIPIITFIVRIVLLVLKYLFLGIWWLITLPIKLFKGGD